MNILIQVKLLLLRIQNIFELTYANLYAYVAYNLTLNIIISDMNESQTNYHLRLQYVNDYEKRFLYSLPNQLIDNWFRTKHPKAYQTLLGWQRTWNVSLDEQIQDFRLPLSLQRHKYLYVTKWWLNEMLQTEPSEFVKTISQYEILEWYARTYPEAYTEQERNGFIAMCKIGPQKKEFKAFINFLGMLMEESLCT